MPDRVLLRKLPRRSVAVVAAPIVVAVRLPLVLVGQQQHKAVVGNGDAGCAVAKGTHLLQERVMVHVNARGHVGEGILSTVALQLGGHVLGRSG